jgi:hypothetical protein
VQSQCDVSASTVSSQSFLEVSAKSVQSECIEVAAPNLVDFDLSEKYDNNINKVTNLKSVQEPKIEPPVIINQVFSAGSNHEERDDQHLKVTPQVDLNNSIVGAKSVHASFLSSNLEVSEVIEADIPFTVQSPCKVSADRICDGADLLKNEVSAKSVHISDNIESINLSGEDLKYIAKSVQSQCELGADVLKSEVQILNKIVSAKSVQSRGRTEILSSSRFNDKVSANSVQASSESKYLHQSKANLNENKKSVQSQCDVSAVSDQSSNLKSKVFAKFMRTEDPTESIISIAGSQRVIVDFLFQLCLWNNSLITPPITKQQLTSETGLLEETALSSIKRLRKKNIIDRYSYKDGKAGWTQYQFAETIYKELLHMREVGAKSVQRTQLEPLRRPSSVPSFEQRSPSNLISNENKQPSGEIGWFKTLDFSKVYPIGPMVVNPAIRTLVHEKLEPELVQDFINRFTSWTLTQGRITSPIGLFCDKLKELAKEGDSPVFTCMTEEERQIEAQFAVHVEKARAEMDLILKARNADKEHAEVANFEKWFQSASEIDKLEFAEPSSLAPTGSEAYKRILKALYFEKMPMYQG